MNDLYSSIYKAFIYAGMIAFIIGFFTDYKTSLGAYITGYSVFILAVLMILIILFSNILKVSTNDSNFKFIYTVLFISGPFLLILCIISFILYLLINYKDNISQGNVAPSYYSFTNIIIMLLFIQFYLVYTNINTEKFIITSKMPKITSSILYLLGVITSVCSIILYTILKYYSTDGFSTIN